ncbi:peptidase inhibitor family I36 protein [Streptomyces sp. SID13726]|uniref:peptidase inhibitor family I36 protein n=1 Tax=Streptomyces sp. SID13726 TaxID=2706058 RepID=UPI0013B72954|nr:peptidase inhibitor family I36 protein [Streptomyces sp. SID13726]NEB03721.1 peptidase inhibitor family I36 protein [Streptomyces sp. SID13726]
MNPLHSRKSLTMRCASLALGLAAASVFTTALASPSIAAPAQNASSAKAADARMEREIAGLLRHNEGAERVGKDRVRLERGVEMTVLPSTRAVAGMGDCRAGYACVWQNSNYTGYRLDFYNYGSYDLSNYTVSDGSSWRDKVSSFFNNQTGGAWMVGKDWVDSGSGNQLAWIFGGPAPHAMGQLGEADNRADVIQLYP